MSEIAKYVLEVEAPEEWGARANPLRHDYETLAGALAAAREAEASGSHALGITYDGLPIFGSEDLRAALERVEAYAAEGGNPVDDARRVLKELGLN
jgi:hypothetical protein